MNINIEAYKFRRYKERLIIGLLEKGDVKGKEFIKIIYYLLVGLNTIGETKYVQVKPVMIIFKLYGF